MKEILIAPPIKMRVKTRALLIEPQKEVARVLKLTVLPLGIEFWENWQIFSGGGLADAADLLWKGCHCGLLSGYLVSGCLERVGMKIHLMTRTSRASGEKTNQNLSRFAFSNW